MQGHCNALYSQNASMSVSHVAIHPSPEDIEISDNTPTPCIHAHTVAFMDNTLQHYNIM